MSRMMSKLVWAWLGIFATGFAMISPGANADETSTAEMSGPKPPDFDIHGFVSQGFFKTSSNNYLGDSKEGSFDFTEVGFNFKKSLGQKLDLGAQVFARKLGPAENFNARFDWFFVNYRSSDQLGFKIGRIKVPFGLYNDASDTDSARIPILLPQSIYPITGRNFLLAHTGAQVYGFFDLGAAGSLGYHVFGGAISIDLPPVTSTTAFITKINTPYVYGSRLLWDTPVEGLKLGFTVQKMRLDFDATVASAPVSIKLPVSQYLGSVEYSYKGLQLVSEYSRWFVDTESTNQAIIPGARTTSERAYTMATYYVSKKLAPGTYYSLLVPDITKRGGHANRQGDLALFLRYDLTPHWLVKLEGHVMDGTAGLSTTLNNSIPLSSLNDHWTVYMVKTTAHF